MRATTRRSSTCRASSCLSCAGRIAGRRSALLRRASAQVRSSGALFVREASRNPRSDSSTPAPEAAARNSTEPSVLRWRSSVRSPRRSARLPPVESPRLSRIIASIAHSSSLSTTDRRTRERLTSASAASAGAVLPRPSASRARTSRARMPSSGWPSSSSARIAYSAARTSDGLGVAPCAFAASANIRARAASRRWPRARPTC